MEILESLDYLKDVVKDAKKIPVSDMAIINRQEILNILEVIRKKLPVELEEAKKIVGLRQEIMTEANREAQAIIKEAEEFVSRRVTEHELTRQAEKTAEEILLQARNNGKEIRIGARDYAGNLLYELQEELEASLNKLLDDMNDDYNKFSRRIEKDYKGRVEIIRHSLEELRNYK